MIGNNNNSNSSNNNDYNVDSILSLMGGTIFHFIVGIKIMWGCFDESKVSISAALHTALSCKNTHYIDLDGFFDLGWDLVSGGYICESGVMHTNEKIGIGVEHE